MHNQEVLATQAWSAPLVSWLTRGPLERRLSPAQCGLPKGEPDGDNIGIQVVRIVTHPFWRISPYQLKSRLFRRREVVQQTFRLQGMRSDFGLLIYSLSTLKLLMECFTKEHPQYPTILPCALDKRFFSSKFLPIKLGQISTDNDSLGFGGQ